MLLCSAYRKNNCCLDLIFSVSKSQQISFQFRCSKILWSWTSITKVEFVSKYYVHWNSSGGLLHWSCKSFLDINVCVWQHRFEVWEQVVVSVSKLGTCDHQWFAQGQKESLWKKRGSQPLSEKSQTTVGKYRGQGMGLFLLTQPLNYFCFYWI